MGHVDRSLLQAERGLLAEYVKGIAQNWDSARVRSQETRWGACHLSCGVCGTHFVRIGGEVVLGICRCSRRSMQLEQTVLDLTGT